LIFNKFFIKMFESSPLLPAFAHQSFCPGSLRNLQISSTENGINPEAFTILFDHYFEFF